MLSFWQHPSMEKRHTRAGKAATDLIVEVFHLNGTLLKSGDQLVKGLGLTSARWQVLGALAMATMPQTVPQVARQMGLSRQAVQRIANDLARKNWVKFSDLPEDRRTRLLSLTPPGRTIYDQATTRQIQWINEICTGLQAEEIATAKALLNNLGRRCRQLSGPAGEKGGRPG
jgi:DNA-binding MarR family transcriptional regulator